MLWTCGGTDGPSFVEICVQWINNNIMICNLHLCIKCHFLWKWIVCCTWTHCLHTLKTIIHARNLITHVHHCYANHTKPWFLKIPQPPSLQMNAIWKWSSGFCVILFWPEFCYLMIFTSHLPGFYPIPLSHSLVSPDDVIWDLYNKRERSKGPSFIQRRM